LLAAAQRAAPAIEEGRQAREGGQDRVDALLGATSSEAHPEIVANAEAGEDLATLRHVAEAAARAYVGRLAGDVGLVEGDAPALRGHEAHERAQQHRLAHPVVPQHADELAGRHLQVDRVEDRDASVAGAHVGRAQEHSSGPAVLAEVDVAHGAVLEDPVHRVLHQYRALVHHRHRAGDHPHELHVVLHHDEGMSPVDLADQLGRAGQTASEISVVR
jgi:hypothetical protein